MRPVGSGNDPAGMLGSSSQLATESKLAATSNASASRSTGADSGAPSESSIVPRARSTRAQSPARTRAGGVMRPTRSVIATRRPPVGGQLLQGLLELLAVGDQLMASPEQVVVTSRQPE